MPVRLLRCLTGTALRAAIRSPAGQATTPGCRAEAASQRQKRKEENFPPRKCARRAPAGEDTPPTGGSLSIQGKCSPPVRRLTKEKPAASASRGAEAIPATRERRSRRAYRPRSGKMRADWPPAASGGQGTRHAAATPAAIRDKGEYGGRRGCRGARPSHPLPPAAQATTPGCRAEAASQRKKAEEKRKKERNHPPRQASSVSRTTSRMSGNLRISSMS